MCVDVFLSWGENGAFDEVGVRWLGNFIERAVDVLNEAATIVAQLARAEHEREITACRWRGGGGVACGV